jgi:hypothetical protein
MWFDTDISGLPSSTVKPVLPSYLKGRAEEKREMPK